MSFVEGEYVVVPLVHPSGAYIRVDNKFKVPILAKVEKLFGDSMSVINFFGYIYTIPKKHAEKFNTKINNDFYTNMITKARDVMKKYGYVILDNKDFYEKKKKVSFGYLHEIPIKTTNINPLNIKMREAPLSPTPMNFSFDFNPTSFKPYYKKSNGKIRLLITEGSKLIHILKKLNDKYIFNTKTNELIIKGYATFVIDDYKTYVDTVGNTFVIYKSKNNYIHIKADKVLIHTEKHNYHGNYEGEFNIKMINKNKLNSIQLQPYLLIEQVVFRKF